ncbi:uncharacterized protein [Anabrus simplex]|uniref:uncharacterized protein n=1 Tax=Anabrus simplex TaxID=316456 RepID=UPI0035A34DCE
MASPAGIPVVKTKRSSYRQRRLGPAPFASFEDLSDDLDSPEEKPPANKPLPGIREDVRMAADGTLMSPGSAASSSVVTALQTPSTPRIDISRASSSSHHDSNNSRDSSPERELFAGETGPTAPDGTKLGLGFKEEGAADLRSSTEELDFHEEPGTVTEREAQRRRERQLKKKQQQAAATIFKYELEAQSEKEAKERKDSACSAISDVGLLSISGRTSRLSSVGSAASGGSVASAASHLSGVSHISGTSHLSVMSGASGVSGVSSGRSPSPHKMLLETSFCGSKPILTQSVDLESPVSTGTNKHETESLEKVLLSRQLDPTLAVIGGGENRPRRLHDHRGSTKSERRWEMPKQKDEDTKSMQDHRLRRKEVERILPISGILSPEERDLLASREEQLMEEVRRQLHEKKMEHVSRAAAAERQREEQQREPQKPVTLNLSQSGKAPKPAQTFPQVVQRDSGKQETRPLTPKVSAESAVSSTPRSLSGTPSASPKLSRHAILKKTEDSAGSRTPSPSSASRKSSFASIFKRSDGPGSVLSPESPTIPAGKRKSGSFTTILKEASEGFRERSRSRSKSRERVSGTGMTVAPSQVEAPKVDAKGKKDSKNKSVFSSLFKKKERKKGTKHADDALSPVDLSSPESKLSAIDPIGNVEFTFNSGNVTEDSQFIPLRDDYDRVDTSIPNGDATEAMGDSLESANKLPRSRVDTSQPITDGPRASGDISKSVSSIPKITGETLKAKVREIPLYREPKAEESQLPSESVMLPTLSHEPVPVEEQDEGVSLTSMKERPSSIVLKEEIIDRMISTVVKVSSTSNLPVAETTTLTVSADAVSTTTTASANEEIDHQSSESERDSEVEYMRAKAGALPVLKKEVVEEEDDHERKGLVLQQDSFEDELPYVPTTLPQERSVAVPIVPIKQRVAEVRTCPIERPRSTTPINPSLLEEYVQCNSSSSTEESGSGSSREQAVEKMRILLPREDSIGSKAKSPRRVTGTAKSWFEFAEQGLQSPREFRRTSTSVSSPSPPPPPLPPRAQPTPPPPQTPPPPKPTSWINFEEIPEKRKPPRRIQTIPSRGTLDIPESVMQQQQQQQDKPVVYSYVNPEDCKCECHEAGTGRQQGSGEQQETVAVVENGSPPSCHEGHESTGGSKLEVDNSADRHSYMSDSSYEYPNPYSADSVDYSEGLKPMKPFGMDLDVSSNRSSIISQVRLLLLAEKLKVMYQDIHRKIETLKQKRERNKYYQESTKGQEQSPHLFQIDRISHCSREPLTSSLMFPSIIRRTGINIR